MHRIGRIGLITTLSALSVGLALISGAWARDSSPSGTFAVRGDLAACVRAVRAKTPGLTDPAGVVRCLRPTRVKTQSDVRWSTCQGGSAPAPGERCETGSAHIEFRATDPEFEWRRGEKGWPRWSERWHLHGNGTANCTRAIHGLPEGDHRARRTASGRIGHVDFLMLWPSGSTPGAIALGIHPRFLNWLRTAPPTDALALDAPACVPLLTLDVRLPPHRSVDVPVLLDPAGVTVRARTQHVGGDPRGFPARWRTVGGPLAAWIDGRTTATFAISADRP